MKDLRIEEATFFPKPNAIFKERKEWEKGFLAIIENKERIKECLE